MSGSGRLIVKSQVVDYQHRGVELESYSVLDFFVETYEAEITKADREADLFEDTYRGPGRPRNPCIRYLDSHPKSGSVHRIIRSQIHRNLPNFLGRWFPRNDDQEIYDFYCASMLLLLKPWRNITIDLKSSTESWASAFGRFHESAGLRARRVLSGIQYFHECESAAQKDTINPLPYPLPPDAQAIDDESGADHTPSRQEFSEEGLALLKKASVSFREELHGHVAIELARHLGIFSSEQRNWTIGHHPIPLNATQDDLARISMWHGLLQSVVDERTRASSLDLPGIGSVGDATIERSALPGDIPLATPAAILLQSAAASEQALPAVDVDCLKPDQLRAYHIITWHLSETLRGSDVPPLRMILYGEGGTGKSRVIQTVTEAFAAQGVSRMLMKAAYTGVAASLVGGKTTHVIGAMSLRSKDDISDAAKKKLQDFWREICYLIIDEYSMLSKTFLTTLSRNISIGMEGSPGFQQGMSFGGLNVILCGDLHQFPPVACGRREPLYYPITADEKMASQVGRRIYEEFSTVVILGEQVRVTDHLWRDFLDHLRYGRVERRHLTMLRTLLLKRWTLSPLSSSSSLGSTSPPGLHPDGTANTPIDFSAQPWADASLITPRHAVRTRWNQAAAEKQCSDSGTHLFVCPSLDTIKGSPLTLEERYALASLPKKGRRRDKGLPDFIHLAIGMKVMVTNNLQTDLDITNGARGIIVDIILNPNEPPLEEGPTITLKHLPECILVKLSRTRAASLPHLEEGVIPIQQVSVKTQIRIKGKARTVTRTQFPITEAYSFTDYRAQGQTIPYVVVDIAAPPTSGLSLFNLYVALSRSSGRGTIQLLRDFDDDTFLQGHVPELLEEDERLQELDLTTRMWWTKMQL